MMNRKNKNEQLKQRLVDAQDGLLSDEAKMRLEEEVKARDPGLWNDHVWMMKQQSDKGVLAELAGMHTEKPDSGAIRRLYNRISTQKGTTVVVEDIVWSWFRRYVLTTGVILIILIVGLQSGGSGVHDAIMPDQMEAFLGLALETVPELDHWLYEDF